MNDNEEYRRYGDPTMLEPIVEQHDDELTTSPMSTDSMDTSFLEEERRARDEVEKFEELEKEFSSNRHGIRVKFASPSDNDRLISMTKTTVIKTEPCFQVNASEDQVTKHFYQNEVSLKNEPIQTNNIQYTSAKTPSEPDSLEEVYRKMTDLPDQLSSSLPAKSILKKPQKKQERSSISRSPSPSSSKKKQTSLTRLDSNEVQYLAEMTGKQTSSLPTNPPRSLFQPTINIFDSSSSRQMTSTPRRPSRLRYYIKPYRGEANDPLDINNQRSRSLSEQRITQQSGPAVWYTFSNQYNRPFAGQSYRRQHISWSPVRDYIHQGRDKMTKSPTKKKESLSNKTSPFLPTRIPLSSSSPCLRTSSSMIPVSVRYRSSQVPQHFHHSFSPTSTDSLETSSVVDRLLTPITPMSQYSQYVEKESMVFISPLPDIVHQPKKEHNETMQRYDRLLEKMRATDEQLQTLSRSWINNRQQKTPIRSNLLLNKTTSNSKQFFSPMILQFCLIILVIFNLLVVYFFNEINVWWSQYISNSVIVEQHDDEPSTF